MNPYLNYYSNQVQYGGALTGFSGVRVQRGHGWFSRMISGIGSFVKDLLPSIGQRALPSAINLAQDVIAGENVGLSAKRRLKEAGRNIADETLDKLKSRLQSGSGIRSRLLAKKRFLGNFLKKYKRKKSKRKYSSIKKKRSNKRMGKKRRTKH